MSHGVRWCAPLALQHSSVSCTGLHMVEATTFASFTVFVDLETESPETEVQKRWPAKVIARQPDAIGPP